MSVICSHVSTKCPAECQHATPHKPIDDHFDDGRGYCHHVHGLCGYRSDKPNCICKQFIQPATQNDREV
jgi:hypothetical protein